MKKVTVNSGRADATCDIAKVEAKYNAKFVGQFCLKDKHGNWVNNPADVYWQATPPQPGYSNYFALIVQGGTLYITSAAIVPETIISAIQAVDGEIIYSRYRHDYRGSKDGTVFIDGGRDYTKIGSRGRLIELKVIDGEFYELEDADYPNEPVTADWVEP